MQSVLSPRDAANLVEPERVHRRLYTDPEIFNLEMRHIFHKAWNFVGHESQVREPGDFFTTTIAGQPVVMVRQPDQSIQVLYNRCGHRGAIVVAEKSGKARNFNCLYHGWVFGTDGTLLFVPLEEGYECSSFDKCDPQYGMRKVPAVANHQGFIFARLTADGMSLDEFLGDIRQPLDHLVDLSPEGSLTVTGGHFRTVYPCNWKIYLENLHDGVHARFVHQSSVYASRKFATEAEKTNSLVPFSVEIVKANGQSYSALDNLDVRAFPNGHSDMRGFRKPIGDDPVFVRYAEQLAARHGAEQAQEILGRNWHNMCVYPNLSIHPGFLQLRVLTPLAVDQTMVEIWNLKLDGAPEELHHRTITYANTVHSPSSIIKPDDLEAYKRVQRGLVSEGSDWVSNHRRYGTDNQEDQADSALSEHFIRNQYKAWTGYMRQGSEG
ncbi:aromatic ring-hydroxylating oxygenase subunit alpha [Govanella unica]|uniref:Aromatic ring-hydroxylating dioxygenase subunit alpha n=1 Tax=Govanella unica TaxID=2975056 RepID=A0A9X3Z8J9_9PROT|nr:aromatic ring-hydroxylating dioxygenase subunit alpha [Govania unica]MDA5194989.1 aromatic ring-hydroxylating dioxygenase subunit alpha [Govania unica]